MTFVRFLLCVCLGTGLIPFVATADSLLPGNAYPKHDCRSPLRPLPGDPPREWLSYQQDMEVYRRCIQQYINTAQEDMQRIQQAAEKAAREYKSELNNGL